MEHLIELNASNKFVVMQIACLVTKLQELIIGAIVMFGIVADLD